MLSRKKFNAFLIGLFVTCLFFACDDSKSKPMMEKRPKVSTSSNHQDTLKEKSIPKSIKDAVPRQADLIIEKITYKSKMQKSGGLDNLKNATIIIEYHMNFEVTIKNIGNQTYEGNLFIVSNFPTADNKYQLLNSTYLWQQKGNPSSIESGESKKIKFNFVTENLFETKKYNITVNPEYNNFSIPNYTTKHFTNLKILPYQNSPEKDFSNNSYAIKLVRPEK